MFQSALISGALASAVVFAIAVYLLPVLIGWLRHVPDLGWAVALAMALRSTPRGPGPGMIGAPMPPAPPSPEIRWGGPSGPAYRLYPPPLDLPPRPGDIDAPGGDAGQEQP
jgi:hypothetical protein